MTRYTIKQANGILPMKESEAESSQKNDSARMAARNNANHYAPKQEGGAQ